MGHTTAIGRALLLTTVGLALGGARCGSSAEVLVWQDEFDGAAGQAPDPANWGFDLGTGNSGWGNNELQYYRAENAALDGAGHLVITARQEDFAGSRYTSARLLSKGKRQFDRGRIEARIKLPVGRGIWPAFWMLGANIDAVSWPACGEIDVMEYRGQEPKVVLGSLHGPGYSGAAAVSNRFTLSGDAGFDADFHVFSVEWDAAYISWAVDGATYAVVTPDRLPAGAPWVFDQDFFLILNLAVGGNFLGPPDASTVFPQAMVIDYVRVYQAP